MNNQKQSKMNLKEQKQLKEIIVNEFEVVEPKHQFFIEEKTVKNQTLKQKLKNIIKRNTPLPRGFPFYFFCSF